jgi:hypothetical protein
MDEPKFCPEHIDGEITHEFIQHLPNCPTCQRVLDYLNEESNKLERFREKVKLN